MINEKMPKVIFRYSWVYDQNWKEWIKPYKNKKSEYPSEKKTLNFIKKAEKIWRKSEEKILKELSETLQLKWKSEFIQCYIVGDCRNFSDPLTLHIYNDMACFVDDLTHELIHRLFRQDGNTEQAKKAWKYIDEKYKKESRITKNHIMVHAVCARILIKFYGEKRLEREIKSAVRPDYIRAWQIVQEEGYQNIIQEFAKRVK